MNPEGIRMNPQEVAQFAFDLLGTDCTVDPESLKLGIVIVSREAAAQESDF
jgi:hypothetical protein